MLCIARGCGKLGQPWRTEHPAQYTRPAIVQLCQLQLELRLSRRSATEFGADSNSLRSSLNSGLKREQTVTYFVKPLYVFLTLLAPDTRSSILASRDNPIPQRNSVACPEIEFVVLSENFLFVSAGPGSRRCSGITRPRPSPCSYEKEMQGGSSIEPQN